MAFTAGTRALRADYNTLRNTMLNILGTGSGDTGYGQTPISSEIPSGVQKIRASQWDNLRIDIQKIADHQGTSVTLTDVGTTTKISAAVGVQYNNALTTLTANRFNIAVGQYSDESAVSSTRTQDWRTTVNHYFRFNFGTYDNARYFFNAGGQIRITPAFSKSTANGVSSINDDWDNLINNIGTVVFNYTSTFSTSGNGTGSSIGFYDLTGSPQQIYIRTGGNINNQYTANDYAVRAYLSGAIIYFETSFNEDKTSANPSIPPGVDEFVTGQLTSTVIQRRPSGSNVNVSSPTSANDINLQ